MAQEEESVRFRAKRLGFLITLIPFFLSLPYCKERAKVSDMPSMVEGQKGDTEEISSIISHLPDSIDGLKRIHSPQIYRATDLYLYIDGGADQYIRYGFEWLLVQDYLEPGKDEGVTVEIYRMKDPLSAFGIMTSERVRGAREIKAGKEGISGDGYALFYKSLFYVKVIEKGMKGGVVSAQTIENVANEVSSILPERESDYDFIRFTMGMFEDGRVRYLPENPRGFSIASGAFEGRIKICGTDGNVLLFPLPKEKASLFEDVRREVVKKEGGELNECKGWVSEEMCLSIEKSGEKGVYLLRSHGFIVLLETEAPIQMECLFKTINDLFS